MTDKRLDTALILRLLDEGKDVEIKRTKTGYAIFEVKRKIRWRTEQQTEERSTDGH